MNELNCIFCTNNVERHDINIDARLTLINCPNCGQYKISIDDFDQFKDTIRNRNVKAPPLHIVSGWIQERNTFFQEEPFISLRKIKGQIVLSDKFSYSNTPSTITDKLNYLLSYLEYNTEYFGFEISIPTIKISIGFAESFNELNALFEALKEDNLLKHYSTNEFNQIRAVISAKGFEKLENLKKINNESKQAFVAMWFDQKMHAIYDNYIVPAVEKAKDGKFKALNISRKIHNNDINSEIIAEIKRSRFLIADLTGLRGGVYFEAGFAKGLGLPVIWTCKKNDFKKIHFDVEHFSFIQWETGEELKEKLIHHINAII